MPIGLTINGGHMDKRINSTASVFNWDENLKFENVLLKAGTDILNPVFIVQKIPTARKAITKTLNYLYCADFKRYYWVTKIVQQAGRTNGSSYFLELHCHVDVLASWSTRIGDTPCYIKYCSDFDWPNLVNLNLDDERLNAELATGSVNTLLLNTEMGQWFTTNKTDQAYAITLGQMGPGMTSTKIWILSKPSFDSLFKSFWKESEFETMVTDVDSYYDWMAKKLGGVLTDGVSFIKDIRVLPFNYNSSTLYPKGKGSANVKNVEIGLIKLDGTHGGASVSGLVYNAHTEFVEKVISVNLVVPSPAITTDTKDMAFLRRKKYLQAILVTPFGNINVSTDNFVNKNSSKEIKLSVRFLIEVTSGDIGIQVFENTSGELLGKISGNISLNMTHLIQPGGYAQNAVAGQIKNASSIVNNIGGAATGVGAGIGLAVGGPVGAAAGGAIGGVVSAVAHLAGNFGNKVASAVQTATSDGGTIIASSNTWANMLMQTQSLTTGDTPVVVHNFEKLFYIQCTGFIPTVCKDVTTYESFASKFGYPCYTMVDNFNSMVNRVSTYIQCSQFNIALSLAQVGSDSLLPDEAEEINRFLNSGIFWEEAKPEGE